jgi:hypothetical protein
MYKLPSKIQFIDKKTKEAFEKLKTGTSEEKTLYGWITRALRDLEENAFCGEQIPKRLIPKEYTKRYGIKNLWKYNLPSGWRLLYSIEATRIVVLSIILEWLDHKKYERRFKY